MAADPGGKEFGDDGGSDGGQRRWAAHQLELKLARGGDALTAVKARELGQTVLAESADSETGTLFVVNTDGNGLHGITAPGFAEDSGSWSPTGNGSCSAATIRSYSSSTRTAPGFAR